MKTCPKCSSHNVIIFDSNNDLCQKCEKWFPALAEEKCIAGCKVYTGEEIKHHKDCPYYPESLSKMYDDLKIKNKKLIGKLAEDICVIAKKIETSNFKESNELKTIGGCFHDIRAERDTKWYKKIKIIL